jgi:hypothetical protein
LLTPPTAGLREAVEWLTSLSEYDFSRIWFILFSDCDYQVYRAAFSLRRDGLTVVEPYKEGYKGEN